MSLDWHALGEVDNSPVHYRKWKVYDLEEPVPVGEYQLSGAPYGGSIAAVSQPSSPPGPGGIVEPMELKIYTSSGVLVATEPIRVISRLVGMGWSDLETLVCVHEDGTAVVYDLFGQAFPPFSLFDGLSQGAAGLKIVEVNIWGLALVALTSDWRILVVDNLGNIGMHGRHLAMNGDGVERLVKVMASGIGERTKVLSMAVLQPNFTSSGQLEVILATNENTVVVVDEQGGQDQLLQKKLTAPIVMMAIAPNGRFMACFLANGMLSVMSTGFNKKILDFDTNSTRKPMQMVWCGEDSVLLTWQGFILMVGPFGHWLQFPYSGVAHHVIPESDCVRILTKSTCEILQRVPLATDNIRRIFSTDPAAMLFDAMERFEDGDVKADDSIKSLIEEGTIASAVKSCILAAVAEFDPDSQKRYLRAATYGMGSAPTGPDGLSVVDTKEFVDACKKLRVLNQVRAPFVGMPLTTGQYDRLKPEVLVDRLAQRRQHHLALKVCELLGISKQKVLTHWACMKLRSQKAREMSDGALEKLIIQKVKQHMGLDGKMSFTSIALAAFDGGRGRTRLATVLLDYEGSAAEKVKLLLSMNQSEGGLNKAAESLDGDLVFLVLLHLLHSLAVATPGENPIASKKRLQDFFALVASKPEASSLLQAYFRYRGDDRLMRYYEFTKNFQAAGTLAIQSSMEGSLEARMMGLRRASTLYSQQRELAFVQKTTEEQVELLAYQSLLEKKYEKLTSTKMTFVDLSVSETLHNLTVLASSHPTEKANLLGELVKIQKQFKVPDKRFWHVKVRALAMSHQWDELRRFANEKKSPIGYRPFAEHCIEQRQSPEVVAYYIERMVELEDRYELYMKIVMWDKALDMAQKLKDPGRLQQIKALCKNSKIEKAVDQMLASGMQ